MIYSHKEGTVKEPLLSLLVDERSACEMLGGIHRQTLAKLKEIVPVYVQSRKMFLRRQLENYCETLAAKA